MVGRMADKVVIVAGAGSIGPGWGNGKASAVLYAREGGRVFCVDRNDDAAKETAAIIEGEGGRATVWSADVTDADAVEGMVQGCLQAYGRIDVLHNNVGIGGRGDAVETTEADWHRVMAVNVTSMFLTIKHTVPVFLEQGGGAIVNVSSLSAVKALRPEIAYAASKGAVNSLTINVAMAYAERNIRCNAVLPGLMDTPLVRVAFKDAADPGAIESVIRARHALSPTGKMGEAWDVAQAALYLASDEAAYVNGLLLHVDAGLRHLVG
jgi:NAD(P)-dependent dehydrogenase (short-subunit alcohol dehydrogenase family)